MTEDCLSRGHELNPFLNRVYHQRRFDDYISTTFSEEKVQFVCFLELDEIFKQGSGEFVKTVINELLT